MGITVIAFDFGTKSIGCAVGQSITGTAQALPAFKAQDGIPNWDAIEKCLKDYGVDFEIFKREIPSMLSDIKKDICTIYNPNKLTDEEYIRLLLKIYFGE